MMKTYWYLADPIGSFGICPGEVNLYEFVEW